MKKWQLLLVALCLTAGTMTAMADDVSESTQPKKESAVAVS